MASHGEPTRRRRPREAWALAALAALAACVYDASDRCGPNQTFVDGYCECAANAVPEPAANRCRPCGANEHPAGDVCVCDVGYGRTSASAPCAMLEGLGVACDPATPVCSGTFSACRTSPIGGYCTKPDCTTDGDCPADWICTPEPGSARRSCKRPPVGQGKRCSSDAECVGTEAPLCDTLYTKTCLVTGCTPAAAGPGDCQGRTICCDLSKFDLPQTVCVPLTSCP